MDKPLVSVNMITYNHEPYIAQAIEGVLQQKTNFPFELVIGEDCSTDGTREIVFDYKKKYPDTIRVITSDKNVGACKNSLRTEKACRGKYIAYCEGDDYWHHPQKLQKQVDYLESHPECGLVFSDYHLLHVENGKLIRDYRRNEGKNSLTQGSPKQILGAFLRGKYGIQTCTVCLRKDILDSLIASDPFLYTSRHFRMGDTQRWAGFSQVSRLWRIDESLATHNLLIESISKSRNPIKVYLFKKSGAELCLYLAEKYELPEVDIKDFQECLWRQSLRLAFYEINAQLAEEVKRSKLKFSLKEWFLYWGSQSELLNFALRPIVWRIAYRRRCDARQHTTVLTVLPRLWIAFWRRLTESTKSL